MRFSAALILGVAIGASAAPFAINHVVHEKRNVVPPGWEVSHRLDAKSVIPLSIGLTQSNLDDLEDYLMEVSAPDSPKWGQHWTPAQIAETFAPSEETVEAVYEWLVSFGIEKERIRHSNSKGWFKVNTTVSEAEQLLQTQFFMHKHASGARQIGCEQYSVPESIKDHIDFISPGTHFDAKVPHHDDHAKRSNDGGISKRAGPNKSYNMGTSPIAIAGAVYADMQTLTEQLANCTQYITPNCLRALYEIPYNSRNTVPNALGIVEYTPQSYYQPDLTQFFGLFSANQKQITPKLKSIDGGFVNNQSLGFGINGESNLDLQYAMTLANPIQVNLYQVGDDVEGASFNNFLDAIDGSYCTFQGGDDPNYDPKYPDPYKGYTGPYGGPFEGPQNCGGFVAPKVISTSYSYPTEYYLSGPYMARQCSEYGKLGLAGTTILYSSGDSGVGPSGTTNTCLDQSATFGNAIFSRARMNRFTVGFPANCPYVTGVGATQVKTNTSVLDTDPEEAADVQLGNYHFTSGGGFSDYFPVPAYQKPAMDFFFANHKPGYTANRYNNTQMARGVPDISANGANYVVVIGGSLYLVYGTSASAPTLGAIFAIINQQRMMQGKSSIGFVNPMLYANPKLLHDITQGTNAGCGAYGFHAVSGWDPVTGLGTPSVPRLLELFLNMP